VVSWFQAFAHQIQLLCRYGEAEARAKSAEAAAENNAADARRARAAAERGAAGGAPPSGRRELSFPGFHGDANVGSGGSTIGASSSEITKRLRAAQFQLLGGAVQV
jgi:hypothetical protein